jgi:polysaccharide chain length determinant protein (PEP-CTERM system associated)
MQEFLEQIHLYARDMWRYRWHAMGVAWLIVLVGWVAVSSKPIIYTASAKIYVDTDTVLRPLLKGLTVDKDTAEYLGLIVRQLVSRSNIEQVARIVGLERQVRTRQDMEAVLDQLQLNIRWEASPASESTKQWNFFTISYPNSAPKFAKQVLQALITTIIEKTMGESLRDSEAARRFLEHQVKEQEEKLVTGEARIRKFMLEHADELPGPGVSYSERLQSAQSAVEGVDLQITQAEHQRDELRRQLANISPSLQVVSTDTTPVLKPESRLLALKAQLDELLLKDTAKHPDVIATRRSIAKLEKQLHQLHTDKVETNKGPDMLNPVGQQLEVMLGQVESEIAALRAGRDKYMRRVEKLREQAGTLTQLEWELKSLNQAYVSAKQKYDALVVRRNSATMSGTVEHTGENVRFRIIDPPRIQDTWSTIARKQLMLTSGMLAAGLAGGLAVAFFLSRMWHPVIYGWRSLNTLTGFPVLGMISQALTPQMRLRRRIDLAAFVLVGMMMLGAHGAALFLHLKNVKHIFETLGGKV